MKTTLTRDEIDALKVVAELASGAGPGLAMGILAAELDLSLDRAVEIANGLAGAGWTADTWSCGNRYVRPLAALDAAPTADEPAVTLTEAGLRQLAGVR